MRRSDREVKDFNDIVNIIEQCDTLHLGMNADGCPYVVPVSYGYDAQDGRVTLYFHGAGTGLKHQLLARDARVCAEMSHVPGVLRHGAQPDLRICKRNRLWPCVSR